MIATMKKKVSAYGGICILPKYFTETFQGCKGYLRVQIMLLVILKQYSLEENPYYNSPVDLAIVLKDVGIIVLNTAWMKVKQVFIALWIFLKKKVSAR